MVKKSSEPATESIKDRTNNYETIRTPDSKAIPWAAATGVK